MFTFFFHDSTVVDGSFHESGFCFVGITDGGVAFSISTSASSVSSMILMNGSPIKTLLIRKGDFKKR
mgnify:CR=1 FL=1